jgi:hypothetical protein
MFAAIYGRLDMVKWLASKGANIEAKTDVSSVGVSVFLSLSLSVLSMCGCLSLFSNSLRSLVVLCSTLLYHLCTWACASLQDGCALIVYAARFTKWDVVKWLAGKGVNINAKDEVSGMDSLSHSFCVCTCVCVCFLFCLCSQFAFPCSTFRLSFTNIIT